MTIINRVNLQLDGKFRNLSRPNWFACDCLTRTYVYVVSSKGINILPLCRPFFLCVCERRPVLTLHEKNKSQVNWELRAHVSLRVIFSWSKSILFFAVISQHVCTRRNEKHYTIQSNGSFCTSAVTGFLVFIILIYIMCKTCDLI